MAMKAACLGSLGTPEWALHGGTAWMTLCLWRPCVTTEIPGETGSVHCALCLQACNASLAERPSSSCLWPGIGHAVHRQQAQHASLQACSVLCQG